MAASLVAPMASSLIEPVISALINTITGKSVIRRTKKLKKYKNVDFFHLLALPLMIKVQ